ncbi:Octopamine receptor beta-2R, partial [Gryllus bimaculatus]
EQCLGRADGSASASLLAALATLDGALLAALVAANALVLLCVVLSRAPPPGAPARDVGRSSRRFIANLAAADAIVGLASAYFLVFRYACAARDALEGRRWLCLSRFFFISNSHLTSAYSMAAIAVDRYVAVVYALRYREIMSFRRSTALLLGAWLFPLLTSCIQLWWNEWRPGVACELETVLPVPLVMGVGALSHLVLLSVVGVTHYRIHRVAAAMVALAGVGGGGSRTRLDPVSSDTPLAHQHHAHPRHAHATKSARTVLLVTGCYFACWLPYMSLYLARVWGASGFALDVAFGLAHTFANLNYLVNPFIYAWKNVEVRCAIVAVCKRLVDSKGPSRVSRLGISTIRMSHIT